MVKLVGRDPPLEFKRDSFPLRGVIQKWISQWCCSDHGDVGIQLLLYIPEETVKPLDGPGSLSPQHELPLSCNGFSAAVGAHFRFAVRALELRVSKTGNVHIASPVIWVLSFCFWNQIMGKILGLPTQILVLQKGLARIISFHDLYYLSQTGPIKYG